MAKKKKSTTEAPKGGLYVPPSKRSNTQGLGVHDPGKGPSPLKCTARYAAEQCDLFPHGGEAFEQWCSDKGISARDQRSIEDWQALLKEFAERPIYGHRRGAEGGTHRANKCDLRR